MVQLTDMVKVEFRFEETLPLLTSCFHPNPMSPKPYTILSPKPFSLKPHALSPVLSRNLQKNLQLGPPRLAQGFFGFLGFPVWGLGFGGLRVSGIRVLGFRVYGLGFGVYGCACRVSSAEPLWYERRISRQSLLYQIIKGQQEGPLMGIPTLYRAI